MNVATKINQKEYLTASEAAALIGVSRRQVLQLIKNDKLAARREHEGFPWLVRRSDAVEYRDRPYTTGRPRKS